MKKQHIYNCLMIIALTVFCVLTIPQLLNHVPWFDEIHAWDLAKEMNLSNFHTIIHKEGHFIIWYLVLMPFAKLKLWYPYSLKLLNWLFYFVAITFMWRKAQFHWIYKIIITFSWASLFYFPIVARCYTVGILGLFILAYLYDKKLKCPILYSLVLVLTAHTSLLATFAVIPLALIFLYEIAKSGEFKNKKDYKYSMLILTVGAILWILPFLNGYGSNALLSENPPNYKILLIFFKEHNYTVGISYLLCLLFLLFSADNKIRIFLSVIVIEFMTFFSLIYCAYPQHIIMLYVYLIIGFWLTPKLHKWDVVSCIFLVIFAIMSNLNMKTPFAFLFSNTDKTPIANYLNAQNPDYVITPWQYSDFSPMLSDNIKVRRMSSYYEKEKKKLAKNTEDYILNTMLAGNNHLDVIVVSEKKMNDNSVPIKCSNKNKTETVYLTKISK